MNGIVEMINRNSINAEMFLMKIGIFDKIKGFGTKAKNVVMAPVNKGKELTRELGQKIDAMQQGISNMFSIIKYLIIFLAILFIISLIMRMFKGVRSKKDSGRINVVVPPSNNNNKTNNMFGWK